MARARGRRRHEEGAPGGKLARELFLSRCGGGGLSAVLYIQNAATRMEEMESAGARRR
jgi:hypothetical protein